MWRYSDPQRLRQILQPQSPVGQSTYDLLLGLRGVGITLQVGLATARRLPGFLDDITPLRLILSLAAPLPAMDAATLVWVEVITGPGILRVESTTQQSIAAGQTILEVNVPKQVEMTQRRQFSRVAVSVPVVFAPVEASPSATGYGGHGQSLDLSAGGMRLLTPTALTPGQHLYISFTTPDGTAFRGILAKVARVNEKNGTLYSAVLRFQGLSDLLASQMVQAILQIRNGPTKR
jgi:hypothetical protein